MTKHYIKLYQLNDSDVYAAEDMQQAITHARQETGVPDDELLDDPYELTDEMLNERMVNVADADVGEPKRFLTFRHALEAMIIAGSPFPIMFSSTEC